MPPTAAKTRSAYVIHKRVTLMCADPSRTKQSMRDECDINKLMAKYLKTGLLDHLNTHHGDYGDFINFEDYHTSLNRIHDAEKSFMTVPSDIRGRFNNDPSKFLEFVQNPDNAEEMVEMGLAHPPPPEAIEVLTGAPPLLPDPDPGPGEQVKGGIAPHPTAGV